MIQSRLYFLQQMIVYMTNAVRWLHWRGSALAPRIYEGGGTSAHTGTGGSPSSAYLSQKRAKKNSKHRKIILFDALLPGIRTPPVPALAQGHFNQGMIAPGNHWNFDSLRAAPPSQVRGARRLSTRTPFGAGALNDHLLHKWLRRFFLISHCICAYANQNRFMQVFQRNPEKA